MFWVNKAFELLLTLLGLGIFRSFIKRYLPKANSHLLDIVLIIALFAGWITLAIIDVKDQELEAFNSLLARANGDGMRAVEDLQAMAEAPMHRFHKPARHAVESLVGSSVYFHIDSSLVERLQNLNYDELLYYYRHSPHVDSHSVLYGAAGNKHMTDEQRADFIALMVNEDTSFRVVQRACLVIDFRLETFQQVNPTAHDQILRKCRVYGKLWGY